MSAVDLLQTRLNLLDSKLKSNQEIPDKDWQRLYQEVCDAAIRSRIGWWATAPSYSAYRGF
jgi:hypothetical protein